MKTIELKISWVPLPKKTKAITLYPFIIYKEDPSETLRKHEMVHVEQVQCMGWIKFYSSYIREHFKKGYKENKYEVEAYRRQDEE